MMVVIGVLLIFLLFGGMGGAVLYQLKKTDPSKTDASIRKDIETAQDFLPFEEIRDSMVHIGNHQYRAYIDASSINFNLKTDQEKQIIEASFQRYLNSLTFPSSLFIHTKTMDNTKQMKSLEYDIEETLLEHPNLAEYAQVYYEEIGQIHERIGNTKQKKKYIIVPFDEAVTLTNSSEEEKYDYVIKEMYNRCQIVRDGLAGMGIEARILTTPEIIELATSVYHRSNYMHVDGVIDGDFTNLIVESTNREENMENNEKIDLILAEALRKIELEISGTRRFGVNEEGEKVNMALTKLRKENKLSVHADEPKETRG